MDSLTFGAPKFLRHLMDPSSKKVPVMEFEIAKVLIAFKMYCFSLIDMLILIFILFQILEGLNLTMDQFIDLCILSGCDYCESIRGIFSSIFICMMLGPNLILRLLYKFNMHMYIIQMECCRDWRTDGFEAHTSTWLY